MTTSTAAVKAVTSVGSAGLLGSIAQDPNFWVLLSTAIIVSTMSFYYDLLAKDITNFKERASLWTKYVIGGQALMFLTFYGLNEWIPEEHQLPDTAWYMLSIVAAGYSMNIIDWSKSFLPSVAEKIRDKVVK